MEVPEGVEVEPVCTEEHEHGVDNIASVDSSMGIMPLTACLPHSPSPSPVFSRNISSYSTNHTVSGRACTYTTKIDLYVYTCSVCWHVFSNTTKTTVKHGSCGAIIPDNWI